MTLEQIYSFGLAVFLVAFKPGPGIVIHTSRTHESGWRAGIEMALGTECSHMILLTISLLSIEIIKSVEFIRTAYVLGVIGGLYIAFCATLKAEVKESKGKFFFDGLVFGPSNPVNIAFYISVIPAIFGGVSVNLIDAIILNVILFIIIFSSHLFYFYLSFRVRRFDRGILNFRIFRLSLKQISRGIIFVVGISLSLLNCYELSRIQGF